MSSLTLISFIFATCAFMLTPSSRLVLEFITVIFYTDIYIGVSYSYAASDFIEVCVGLFQQKRSVRLYALENLYLSIVPLLGDLKLGVHLIELKMDWMII
jgi:hypothetical protein